jgi:hypothetical protein
LTGRRYQCYLWLAHLVLFDSFQVSSQWCCKREIIFGEREQMRRSRLTVLSLAVFLVGALGANCASAACTQTGFYRDNINMTAAMIANGDVLNQTIDATGCNIGIFYGPGTSGTVDNTEVYGANYFGILASGDIVDSSGNATLPGATSVDVTNSAVHDIGESPFNGTQHGVAIYYRACASGSSATGTLSLNNIYLYQKGGIVANCPGTSVSVSSNAVAGNGPVNYIAQNGIQIGFGASGQVMRNTVAGHSYTGANNASSAGILVFGGCGSALTTGVQVVKNVIGGAAPGAGNDVGVWLANYDDSCAIAPDSMTNVKVINNKITNTEITNVSGNGFPKGYQAGISDSGINDKMVNNNISGIGYVPPSGPCMVPAMSGTEICPIDASLGVAAKVHANSYSFGP